MHNFEIIRNRFFQGTKNNLAYSNCLIILAVFLYYYVGFINEFIDLTNGINPNDNAKYSLSEWLINYEGGFVGRGLAGQLFRLVSNQSFLFPTINISVHIVGVIVTLTLMLLIILRSSKLNIRTILIFSLLPAGLPLVFSDIYYRKEMLFHLITILHLVLVHFTINRSNNSKFVYVISSGLLFSVLGSAAALTHESYIFICLPINYIITLYFLYNTFDRISLKQYIKAIIFQVMPIICCVAAFMNKGNLDTSLLIWKSISGNDLNKTIIWENINNNWVVSERSYNAIVVLSVPMSYTIKQQLNLIFSTEMVLWILIITTTVFYAVEAVKNYLISQIGNSDLNKAVEICNGTYLISIILLLCSSPLYLLAIDYGRWLSSIIITFILVLLFSPNIVLFMSRISAECKVIEFFVLKYDSVQKCLIRYLWPDSSNVNLRFLVLILWLSCIKVNICSQSLSSTFKGTVPIIINNLSVIFSNVWLGL